MSKPTLFKYFPTKEDLVLHRIADHQGEAARVVRRARPGEAPLAALRRHFLDGLERRDPVTGLNDHPGCSAYHRMVFETPSLAARVLQLHGGGRGGAGRGARPRPRTSSPRGWPPARSSPCSGCWPAELAAAGRGGDGRAGPSPAVAAADRAFDLLPEPG